MKVLWLLVARGGSKGVPGKNLRVIGGRSLIARKIAGARPAMGADDMLVCSTDSHDIADEAVAHGALVPFMRPPELATDTASTSDVVWHAMKQMRELGKTFDVVSLLEPSAPFSLPKHYAEGLAKMAAGADSAIGVREAAPHSDFVTDWRANGCIANLAEKIARMERSRRQDMPLQVTPSGGLYMGTWDMLERCRTFYGSFKCYGVMQDRWTGLEIDEPEDLALAEFLVERGLV